VRIVSITPEGAALVERAPLAGPVRLRQIDHEPARLERLATGLEDAIALFGLEAYAPERKEGRQ
jgi:hypothetical protein